MEEFDFELWLEDHIRWSNRTFGATQRVEGVLKHIEAEIEEVRADPSDLAEWIDIVILALDGAWRAGYTPLEIIARMEAKQQLNFTRSYPPVADDEPSFHLKET